MFTPKVFSKSFFYIAPGLDFEPLIRFSHLTDTFIYVNLYLTKSEVKESITKYLEESDFLQTISIQEYDDFDETIYFELSKNYRNDLNKTFRVLNRSQRQEYENAFLPALAENQWMLEIDVLRKGLNRNIKLYYMTAEGLASYIALSHNGIFPPFILCTVQTKILEIPNGLMSQIFQHTKTHPKIWVRGVEEEIEYFFTHNQSTEVLKNSDKLFNKIGSDFSFSWVAQGTYLNNHNLNIKSKRYCKAFITDKYLNEIKRPKTIPINNNFIHTEGISSLSNKINKNSKILILTNNRLKQYVNSLVQNVNISYWDNLFQNYNDKISLQKSIDFLKSLDEKLEFDEIHFTPYGLEDEGQLLLSFLKSKTHKIFHAYLYRPLDFIDII
jgi:hypothetical protein